MPETRDHVAECRELEAWLRADARLIACSSPLLGEHPAAIRHVAYADSLAAMLAERELIRQAGIEECAKVAEDVAEEWADTSSKHQGKEGSSEMEKHDRCNARAMTASNIAATLRALKP